MGGAENVQKGWVSRGRRQPRMVAQVSWCFYEPTSHALGILISAGHRSTIVDGEERQIHGSWQKQSGERPVRRATEPSPRCAIEGVAHDRAAGVDPKGRRDLCSRDSEGGYASIAGAHEAISFVRRIEETNNLALIVNVRGSGVIGVYLKGDNFSVVASNEHVPKFALSGGITKTIDGQGARRFPERKSVV